MEKYAVVIDPKKVEQEKIAGKNLSNNPDANIPLDDEKGSLPYEKEPTKKQESVNGES